MIFQRKINCDQANFSSFLCSEKISENPFLRSLLNFFKTFKISLKTNNIWTESSDCSFLYFALSIVITLMTMPDWTINPSMGGQKTSRGGGIFLGGQEAWKIPPNPLKGHSKFTKRPPKSQILNFRGCPYFPP